MRDTVFVALAVAAACIAAIFYVVPGAAAPARPLYTGWNAGLVTSAIVRSCSLNPSYLVVRKSVDGWASLETSPSISEADTKCALGWLEVNKISVRK